ncbi:MFS transporter [Kitasatospora sp. NA04385]|uniref:MFS transporter n=1 Tax=Kitasatospora sp. NA04385 TaxID=2742135 RepID=UPI001590DF8B|nr:MFS transporter [Kitasatospora sp. NA04385]QKW20611.1 MFS transporter [Kitasatospora sp. NA04385]
MAPIALLLTVRAEHGPVLLGAALASLYALASAIGQPLLGRLVDRTRLVPVAAATAALSTTAFALLAASGCTAHPAAAAVLAVLAGAATPPLEAAMRAMWPRLLPRPEEQRAAFTLDSVSQELLFVIGPLTATILAQLASPASALAVCAVATAAGTAAVAAQQPSRRTPPAAHREVHWTGALRSRGLLLLLAAMFFLGVNLGAFNVLALTLADATGSTWLAGLLPATVSVGSLAGGLLFARSPWPHPPSRQLLYAAAGFALCGLPLLLVTSPPFVLAVSLCPGLYLAPLVATAFLLADRLALPGTATEAAAWLIAVIGLGQAAGSAAAGRLAALGTTGAACVPVMAAVLVAAILAARHDLLTPTTPMEKPA